MSFNFIVIIIFTFATATFIRSIQHFSTLHKSILRCCFGASAQNGTYTLIQLEYIHRKIVFEISFRKLLPTPIWYLIAYISIALFLPMIIALLLRKEWAKKKKRTFFVNECIQLEIIRKIFLILHSYSLFCHIVRFSFDILQKLFARKCKQFAPNVSFNVNDVASAGIVLCVWV